MRPRSGSCGNVEQCSVEAELFSTAQLGCEQIDADRVVNSRSVECSKMFVASFAGKGSGMTTAEDSVGINLCCVLVYHRTRSIRPAPRQDHSNSGHEKENAFAWYKRAGGDHKRMTDARITRCDE